MQEYVEKYDQMLSRTVNEKKNAKRNCSYHRVRFVFIHVFHCCSESKTSAFWNILMSVAIVIGNLIFIDESTNKWVHKFKVNVLYTITLIYIVPLLKYLQFFCAEEQNADFSLGCSSHFRRRFNNSGWPERKKPHSSPHFSSYVHFYFVYQFFLHIFGNIFNSGLYSIVLLRTFLLLTFGYYFFCSKLLFFFKITFYSKIPSMS